MLNACSFHGFAGAFAVACKTQGLRLRAVVEPGGFGSDVVDQNREWLGFDGPIHEGPYGTAPAYDDVDVLLGNPPCSAWSAMNSSKTNKGRNADVSRCMWEFVRYAASLNEGRGPQAAIFESVQAAGIQGRDMMRELRDELETLTNQKWELTHLFMSGASVGAAQVRKRYFWIAHQTQFGVDSPNPQRVFTYEDALGDLVGLKLTRDWQPAGRPSPWAESLAHLSEGEAWVTDHIIPDNRYARMMAAVADLELWPPGEDCQYACREWLKKYGSPPPEWNPNDVRWAVEERGFSKTVRVLPQQPGYVIAGDGGYGFLHWAEPRILTVRECARLMGFPDDVQWGWLRPEKAYMYLGKQVPVQSWEWALRWLRDSLMGERGSWKGDYSPTEREWVINVTHDYRQCFDPKTKTQGVDTRSAEWKREMARRS